MVAVRFFFYNHVLTLQVEQTEAMQAVAPEGFKVHYDFTMYGDRGGYGSERDLPLQPSTLQG